MHWSRHGAATLSASLSYGGSLTLEWRAPSLSNRQIHTTENGGLKPCSTSSKRWPLSLHLFRMEGSFSLERRDTQHVWHPFGPCISLPFSILLFLRPGPPPGHRGGPCLSMSSPSFEWRAPSPWNVGMPRMCGSLVAWVSLSPSQYLPPYCPYPPPGRRDGPPLSPSLPHVSNGGPPAWSEGIPNMWAPLFARVEGMASPSLSISFMWRIPQSPLQGYDGPSLCIFRREGPLSPA